MIADMDITVSVIIPTFKRKKMLFYEIEKLIEQKNVVLDIIVINDDIANDPTDEIKIKYPFVTYIKNKIKIGPGQKHQVGYKLAKGKYVSFPDDDDYLIDPLFFYKAITIMEENPSIAFVSGNSYIKYEDEPDKDKQFVPYKLNVSGQYDRLDFIENMQGKYNKPLSSFPTLFRKDSLDAQCFMDQIEMSDVSLYLLALLSGDAFIIDDYVGVYRIHSRSLTTKRSSPVWIINVLKQKEYIYGKIKSEIKHPGEWWIRHFFMTYRFYANTSKNRFYKLRILIWGLFHGKHSIKFLLLFCREILLVMENK